MEKQNNVVCNFNVTSGDIFSDLYEEGGKGGIMIPFHAQILTKIHGHVLNQSLSEKPQGNEVFTTKRK